MKRTTIVLIILTLVCAVVQAQNSPLNMGYKKALFIGAHPDDNESCAGGTMILLQKQGCEVVSVYMTSGERGIKGASLDEAASIRRKELAEACKVMGVRYRLMTQIDGQSEINAERYKEMLQVIEEEKPDVVFTHWPIELHRDHRNCSALVLDAWKHSGRNCDLYYYEAELGQQTRNFSPNSYVNIESVVEQKHKALLCHESQKPQEILTNGTTTWKNSEAGSPSVPLPRPLCFSRKPETNNRKTHYEKETFIFVLHPAGSNPFHHFSITSKA
ncbi:MAG: PIG-L family deacetylase [Bacteroidaceae bacterium]|nr:PIG-L family deacetylase [Bacteroidaceae bacterium]MBR5394276.1 PIG-L family deacetylase [Bacteroidaceae bacterium]